MKTLFVGDICPTDFTLENFCNRETEKLFTNTVELFKESDFSCVNLECAITDSNNAIKKFGPNLKAPFETASIFSDLGVTVAGISNNHVFDFGREGAKDTIKALSKAGIDYTGFGNNYQDAKKNYIYEKNGERICVIAVCEHEYSYALEDRMGSRSFDEFETIEEVREAKKNANRVIVMYHGGKEMCHYPSPRLIRVCRALVRAGADLVMCQHTHCIGAYEKYQGGHILYGQGNFNFAGRSDTEAWNTGLAVSYETSDNTIDLIPVKTKEDGDGIRLANESEKADVLADIKKYSDSLRDGTWSDGWRAFCEGYVENYLMRLGPAFTENATELDNAALGHYLDCEAHSDVLREIFATWNHTNERD